MEGFSRTPQTLPLTLSSSEFPPLETHFFQVRGVLNLSQGTLGKDLLTTSHPDCDRGKVESPVVPGVWTGWGTAREERLEGKDHGTIMGVRRTLWAGLP